MIITADLKKESADKVEMYAINKGISRSEAIRQLIEAGLQVGGDALASMTDMFNKFSLEMHKRFDEQREHMLNSSRIRLDEEIKKQADRLAKMVYTANVDSRLTVYILKAFIVTFYEKTQKMDEETKQKLNEFLENQIASMTERARKDLAPANQKNKQQLEDVSEESNA